MAEEFMMQPLRFHPPPKTVWVLLALCLAGAAAVLSFDITRDNGTTNCIVAFLALLAVVTAGVWYTCLSGLSKRARFIPPATVLAGVAGFFACFKLDHVTGEMIPGFVPRFSKKPDERLGRPQPRLAPQLVPTLVPRDRPDKELARPASAANAVDRQPSADLTRSGPLDFPQFLGPNRNAAVEGVLLDPDWTTTPPREVWKRRIGAGWSAFAIVNGYAVTMEQRGPEEMVTCCRLASGDVVWFHARQTRYESILGGVGPRSTPTIHDGRVYTMGATGWLSCLDGNTGALLWEKHLPTAFGISADDEADILPFARSNSPLIVNDLVVVPAGGPGGGSRVSLVAYHRVTGGEVWRGGSQQLSHASPAPAMLCGVRQILTVNENTVAGHDPATGRELWQFDWAGNNQVRSSNSQAVPVPPDRVFVSKGMGGGAKLVRLLPHRDGAFGTQTLWHNTRVLRTKFTNVTLLEGCVYGLSDGILECVELETGRRAWKSGRYKHGQILRIGRHLIVLTEDGEAVLVEATPERANRVLGRFQALDGHTWNNLAFSPPFLLLRNAEWAACYELPLRDQLNAELRLVEGKIASRASSAETAHSTKNLPQRNRP